MRVVMAALRLSICTISREPSTYTHNTATSISTVLSPPHKNASAAVRLGRWAATLGCLPACLSVWLVGCCRPAYLVGEGQVEHGSAVARVEHGREAHALGQGPDLIDTMGHRLLKSE